MSVFQSGRRPKSIPLLAVFDRSLLKELYDNDVEHFASLLGLFNRSIPSEIRELESALRAKKWAEAKRITHRLKPKFSMVCLPDHRQAAQQFEQSLQQPTNAKELGRRFHHFRRMTIQALSYTQKQEAQFSKRQKSRNRAH